MQPADDLTCQTATSFEDQQEVVAVVSLIGGDAWGDRIWTPDASLFRKEDPSSPIIDVCASPNGTFLPGTVYRNRDGFQRGRYLRLLDGEEVAYFGPYKGKGWKERMAEDVIALAKEVLLIEPDPGLPFVKSSLSVLREVEEASMPVADLLCETRFILPHEVLEPMKVVSYRDGEETSFGVLGIINGTLRAMGSRYMVVSQWGGDDQSEFIGFGAIKDGELADL